MSFPRIGPRPALALFAATWAIYLLALHPWLMNWGATPDEQAAPLPGDELLPAASPYFTRGITIRAPASAVWPWLLQIGQERGGFYSNTWLENLTGAGIHNAGSIHPEWQHRAIGDRVLLARPDLLGGRFAAVAQTRILALEPGRLIANIPTRFVLQAIDGRTTRLLLREAIPATATARFLNALVWDPMHFVMQQRMLRGIKERAEGTPLVPPVLIWLARTGWILATAALSILFLVRRAWWPWLLPPLAAAILVLRPTGDWDAAMAAFLAVGITLAFGRRWWPVYLLLSAAIALVLLLAPDAYTAFGTAFCLCIVPWWRGL